jgi:hypothetical protein
MSGADAIGLALSRASTQSPSKQPGKERVSSGNSRLFRRSRGKLKCRKGWPLALPD